jgi:hypothetical protein
MTPRGFTAARSRLMAAALNLADALDPRDHPEDLFMAVTRRTRTGTEYVLYAVDADSGEVTQAVYRGDDPGGLEHALGVLAGLFDDITPPRAAQPAAVHPPGGQAAPGGPAPRRPAGAARASRQADSAVPAGATRGLRGQAALDAIRAAETTHKAGQRRGRVSRAARQPAAGAGRIWPGGRPGGDAP